MDASRIAMSHQHQLPSSYNRAFALGVALNLGYVAVEAGWGFAVDSLALLADAGHNLSDVFSLLLAWGAALVANRRSTLRRSYGYRRVTILAAQLSSLLLLGTILAIAWEAVSRLQAPSPTSGATVMVVAGIGVLINAATALLFLRGSSHDLNIRGAYLHMVADAAVSLGVVVAGGLIMVTGWLWLDPLISLVVVCILLFATWDLLRDSTNLLLDRVPPHIEPASVERYLLELPGVASVHDLHIWSVSTSETVLTAHLVMPVTPAHDGFLRSATEGLFQQFAIGHSTIQIERSEVDGACQKTVCR